MVLPEAVPRALGRDLRWSLSAGATPDFSLVELTDIAAHGAGIDVAGSGRVAEARQRDRRQDARNRRRTWRVLRACRAQDRRQADARRHGGAARRRIACSPGSTDRVANLDTGVPAVNALAGRSVAIAGSAERDRSGVVRLDRLALTGDDMTVARERAFRSGTGNARGQARRRYQRSAAGRCGAGHAGRRPGCGRRDGRGAGRPSASACPARRARHCGPARPRSIRCGSMPRSPTRCSRAPRSTAAFAAAGSNGSLSLTADASDAKEMAIRDLLLKAEGGVINADLRLDRKTLLARGKISRPGAQSRALVSHGRRAALGPARR